MSLVAPRPLEPSVLAAAPLEEDGAPPENVVEASDESVLSADEESVVRSRSASSVSESRENCYSLRTAALLTASCLPTDRETEPAAHVSKVTPREDKKRKRQWSISFDESDDESDSDQD